MSRYINEEEVNLQQLKMLLDHNYIFITNITIYFSLQLSTII